MKMVTDSHGQIVVGQLYIYVGARNRESNQWLPSKAAFTDFVGHF